MKFFAITLATLVLSLTAQAGRGIPGGFRDGGGYGHGGAGHGGFGGDYRHGGGIWHGGLWTEYPTYRSCGWDGWYCNDGYASGGVAVACAPEVVEGNVKTTEKALSALAATPAFATAKTFKAELTQVAALKDAGEKAQAYLQLAGIDSNDKAAVATFIGSRDTKGAWITDLQRNADLSNSQAEAVATGLQTALRGNLQ